MATENQVKANREFGLIVGGVFMLIAAYGFFRKGHLNSAFAVIGVVLIGAAILIPSRLTLVKALWEKVGRFLGYVNTIVLLTVVYLFIVTPMAVFNRLAGKDSLKVKADKGAETYWEAGEARDRLEMKQQF